MRWTSRLAVLLVSGLLLGTGLLASANHERAHAAPGTSDLLLASDCDSTHPPTFESARRLSPEPCLACLSHGRSLGVEPVDSIRRTREPVVRVPGAAGDATPSFEPFFPSSPRAPPASDASMP